MAKLAVHVDDGLHNDLKQMMGEHDKQIQNQYKEGSFHRLFCNQQLEAMSKHPTQCRWHPIPFLVDNPSMQDYTHYIKSGVGIQPEVTQQLMKVVQMETFEDWQKYVAVIFDEMKIKELRDCV